MYYRPDMGPQNWRAEDRSCMLKALRLARMGLGTASPNPPVGCLLVRRGMVVGRGYHVFSNLDHAEVMAVREAGGRAYGATAYVTLEPCAHYGRTPPCVDLLVRAGVRRVVTPLADPNPAVAGRGIEILRSAGILVDVGLMQTSAARLIEPFACHVSTGRPLVVAKVGMSLDGKIATRSGASRWITSDEGRAFGRELRFQMDAVLVGSGTVLADDPELIYRGSRSKARPLLRVVLDGRLRTPVTARLVRNAAETPVLVFCASEASTARRRVLEKRGVEIFPVPRAGAGLDLHRVLAELAERKALGVLVEGGSSVHWSFVSAGLVDKFYFIMGPLVLGGSRAVPSVGGSGYEVIAEAPRFAITRTRRAGPDIVLEAYPTFSRSIVSPWRLPAVPASFAQACPPSSGRK